MQDVDIDNEKEDLISEISVLLEDYQSRQRYIQDKGFLVISPKLLDKVKEYDPIIEVFAGTGFFNVMAREHDIDIISTDNHRWSRAGTYPGADVKDKTASDAIRENPDRNVFMSWPPLNEPHALYAAFEMKPGRYLLCVTEGKGGACADDAFFKHLDEAFIHIADHRSIFPSFPGINDYLSIYEKT